MTYSQLTFLCAEDKGQESMTGLLVELWSFISTAGEDFLSFRSRTLSSNKHHVQVRKLQISLPLSKGFNKSPLMSNIVFIYCIVSFCWLDTTHIMSLCGLEIWILILSLFTCRFCLVVCVSLIFGITANPVKPLVCIHCLWLSTILDSSNFDSEDKLFLMSCNICAPLSE